MSNINIEQLKPVLEKLKVESDRACTILAIATLDAFIENLLRQSMLPDSPKELFEGNGALATFSAKIDLAYSFGLISANERHDLHLLRKIRNDFAHAVDHELAFNIPKMADRVRALTVPQQYNDFLIAIGLDTKGLDTIRLRFEIFVSILILLMEFRIRHTKAPPEPSVFTSQPPNNSFNRSAG